jgi:hypothetical protein
LSCWTVFSILSSGDYRGSEALNRAQGEAFAGIQGEAFAGITAEIANSTLSQEVNNLGALLALKP